MVIKSLDELRKIKEKAQADLASRKKSGKQVIIGMGTCGIAAGAREVMNAVLVELSKRKLDDVSVIQTGCIGMCEKEPLLDIVRPGEDRVTYGHVTPSDVSRIISDHLVNGNVVDDLVVAKIKMEDNNGE